MQFWRVRPSSPVKNVKKLNVGKMMYWQSLIYTIKTVFTFICQRSEVKPTSMICGLSHSFEATQDPIVWVQRCIGTRLKNRVGNRLHFKMILMCYCNYTTCVREF